jgi:hypothetical protein
MRRRRVGALAFSAANVKSCGATPGNRTIRVMDQSQTPLRAKLPLRPQDETECRRCEVHCDKVVYPAACLDRGCPFVYAFEEFGHTYIGCMQKVFDVEIDIDLLQEAERTRAGFGAVKVRRGPLPMCKVEVERCYEQRIDELGCVNPEFSELPVGAPTFRVFAQVVPNQSA